MSETRDSSQDNDSDEWYYVDKGDRKGPVDQAFIKLLLDTNKLDLDSHIWRKGLSDWRPVKDSELAHFVSSTPPPLMGDQISNYNAWTVALFPLAWAVLAAIAADPTVHKGALLRLFTTVPWSMLTAILLNTITCLRDESRLKKAGYGDRWMTAWAIFLVPVYLFSRAKKLKQRPTYAITWIVSFLVYLMVLGSLEQN